MIKAREESTSISEDEYNMQKKLIERLVINGRIPMSSKTFNTKEQINKLVDVEIVHGKRKNGSIISILNDISKVSTDLELENKINTFLKVVEENYVNKKDEHKKDRYGEYFKASLFEAIRNHMIDDSINKIPKDIVYKLYNIIDKENMLKFNDNISKKDSDKDKKINEEYNRVLEIARRFKQKEEIVKLETKLKEIGKKIANHELNASKIKKIANTFSFGIK